MNRQRFLLYLLVVTALVSLPFLYYDQTVAKVDGRMRAIAAELEQLRPQTAKARELEAQIAQRESAYGRLDSRLIGYDPFAQMQRVLADLAGQSGLSLTVLNLVGGEPHKEMPDLLRYRASVTVRGTPGALVTFLGLLEQHPLLIELPDLIIAFPDGGATAPAAATVSTSTGAPVPPGLLPATGRPAQTTAQASAAGTIEQTMSLHFFGRVPTR